MGGWEIFTRNGGVGFIMGGWDISSLFTQLAEPPPPYLRRPTPPPRGNKRVGANTHP